MQDLNIRRSVWVLQHPSQCLGWSFVFKGFEDMDFAALGPR